MPDYLQDLLDRVSDYVNPSKYPATAFDPTATDEENKKKKAAAFVPPWAQRAGAVDTSTPLVSQLLANPANPAYGVNPMSSQLSQAMAAKAAQSPAPGLPPPYPAQLPPAQPFPDPEPNPSPVAADATPLPRERPTEAPPREQREVSGDAVPATDKPGQADDQAALPRSAAPTMGQQAGMLPGAGAGGAPGIGDIGSRIMSGLSQHSNLLLAMGAGLMGAPNVWQGLGRGFSYAGPAAQQDVKAQQLIGQQQATYNALIGAGAPPNLAHAATLDDDLKKTMLQTYVADRGYEIKPVETTNGWGEKQTRYLAVNKFNPMDSFDIQTGQHLGGGAGAAPGGPGAAPAGPGGVPTGPGGAPAGPGGAPAAAPAAAGGGLQQPQSQFYAPGVNDQNYDQNKTGEDYLAQFSPGVQAEIKDRVQGLQPATQSRGNVVQQRINMAAEKYGRDIGMPMDASSIAQRTKYARDLASEAATTAGGKKRALQQGLSHFAQLSDAMVDLNLSGGAGIEKFANFENWVRSQSTERQGKIATAQALGDRLAGEMGQLTSTAGGSKGEREKTAQLVSDAFGSGKKSGGALKGIVDILQGGIDALVSQRDDLFPAGNAPKGANFIGSEQQAQIDHIKHNIAVLEGKAPRPKAGAAPATATATPKPKGNYDYDPATGGFVQR